MGMKLFGAGKRPAPYQEITTVKTASGIAVTGACLFNGIIVYPEGQNVTITIYNNTAASGSTLLKSSIVIPGNKTVEVISLDPGIKADNGVYVSVTCSGSYSWQVLYDQG